MNESRIPWLPLLGSAAIALWAFGGTLDGGFLSDDVLLQVLSAAGDDGFDVDWNAVFADFARPWLGVSSSFYRPLLTVSFALDQSIGGGAAWPFHVTNLLLHVALAALSAAIAAVVVPERRVMAAWIAGLAVALHPVAVEPVAWIAARNSGLEVFWRTSAMLAFVLWRRGDRSSWRAVTLLAAACAFATKESAVMLPVSLLALDLLAFPRDGLVALLRRHAPFALLVAGYFVLRRVVLGVWIGSGEAPADGDAIVRLVTKLTAVLAPTTAVALAIALAAIVGLVRRPLWLLGGAAWIVAHGLPTWQLEMTENFGGSRMVYGALPVLGIVVAGMVRGLPRLGGALFTVAWLALLLGTPTRERLAAYDAAWRDMADAVAGISSLAERASAARPLAIAAMPVNAPGIPPCNPNAWFPFAERPLQPVDIPVVSLGFVTVEVPFAEALYRDASAFRALAEQGCAIAAWDAPSRSFLVRQQVEVLPPLPALRRQGEAFRFARPVPATAVEALTIRIDGPPPRKAELRVLHAAPEPIVFELAAAQPDAGGARYDVDLTHDLLLTALATFQIPLQGFAVDLDGDATIAGIDAHPRVPELALPRRFAGARIGLGAFAGLSAPSTADGAELRLVLLGPHAAIPIACRSGAAIEISAAQRREFEDFARFTRQDRLWYWFEATTRAGRAGFARSPVDWFEFDADADAHVSRR